MLKDLRVKELRGVADAFGIDDSASKSKAVLLAELAEEGVTEEDYKKMFNIVEDPEPVAPPVVKTTPSAGPEILVKMNRANPTYEIRGYRFTSEHPYVVMSQEDAQAIFDADPRGFVTATPKELEDYYS
jgi:hypothetical protein